MSDDDDARLVVKRLPRRVDRETLDTLMRLAARQSEMIRARVEWLHDARARLWDRMDRLRALRATDTDPIPPREAAPPAPPAET